MAEVKNLETIDIGDKRVTIDPSNLQFSEATLSDYIQKEGGFYDNFGYYLSLAEKLLQMAELKADRLYNERFLEAKEKGGKTIAEAQAKASIDQDVVSMREFAIEAKYKVKRLMQHLKAWDKNHDNATSMGHMLRKQMEKLQSEIMAKAHNIDITSIARDRQIENLTSYEDQKAEMDQDSTPAFDTLSSDNLF